MRPSPNGMVKLVHKNNMENTMTKVTLHRNPFIDRDQFLTPFDKIFDAMFEEQFLEVVEKVGAHTISRISLS